jgi:hypothetical protein
MEFPPPLQAPAFIEISLIRQCLNDSRWISTPLSDYFPRQNAPIAQPNEGNGVRAYSWSCPFLADQQSIGELWVFVDAVVEQSLPDGAPSAERQVGLTPARLCQRFADEEVTHL